MRFFILLSVCILQFVSAPIISISHANFAAWDMPSAEHPATQWQIKESAHFAITYPDSNEAMADKALNIAERVHSELVPFFMQGPEQKTQMALVDDFDFSNGWATFFPFAQIRLFSSPPDSIDGLEVNDDWLHTLIRHEYVHVLHMQMARGLPKSLRDIFGNIILASPHSMTPSFMLEGLATYLETHYELGYGRLQGSYYRMQMRAEVAAGRLKTLGDVAAPLRDWPLGMNYLYGSYFYQFLADTYGEKAIVRYLQQYSREGIPAVMQNHSMASVIGKDFDQLWQNYQQWLNKEFADEILILQRKEKQGETIALDVNRQGLFKDVSNSQDDYFYFVDNNGEDTPTLNTYHDGNVTVLTDTKDLISLDVNEQHAVVASRMITWADGRSWADIFLLQEGITGKYWQPLTEKSRLRNVRWLNSNTMIASRKINGISEFVVLNKQGDIETLWHGEDETTVLGDFDMSPQGDYLVVSVKRAQQGWNLERIDLTQTDLTYAIDQWQPITQTKAIENSPQILSDGRILFSADYDGVYNIFLLNPANQEVTQITDMLTGAFEPKLIRSRKATNSSASQVIFQAYSADGFEFRTVALVDTHPTLDFTLADKQGQYNYPKPYSINVEKTPAEIYSPWSSLQPRWWFPYYVATEEATQIGVTTGGSDTLGRHNYSLSFGLDWANKLTDLSLQYGYDNRYQLSFQRSHEYVDVFADEAPEYIVEQDRWAFARNHILNAFEDQLSLNAGILVEREGTISRDELFTVSCLDANAIVHKTCEKTLSGLGLRFDSREGYLNSPGFSAGRYFDLVYETNDVLNEISGSDYKGGILQGQWQEIFDLPGRRSLSLQVLAAQSDKNNEVMTIGGENRLAELSLFGRDDFALRGYSSSIQYGHTMNINRINYSQWLARIDKGWGIWPLGAGDLSLDVYADYGSAWQQGESPDYLTGVGIDLNIEVLAFYNMLMPIRFSIAHGLDKELGGSRAGVGISLPY